MSSTSSTSQHISNVSQDDILYGFIVTGLTAASFFIKKMENAVHEDKNKFVERSLVLIQLANNMLVELEKSFRQQLLAEQMAEQMKAAENKDLATENLTEEK